MNLLCPNCQKMLTVPEEFAGQLMKCPLCGGTFTVPSLPGTAPPPPPPEPDHYSIRPEGSSTPPSPSSSPPLPPAPDFELSPPLPTTATTTKPSAALAPPPPYPPEGYLHTATLWLSPRVLPWIAPACLLLVFILQFFSWVGLYPGGMPAATQNAWQTAFGFYSEDRDLKPPALQDKEAKPGASVLTIFYLLLFFPVLAVTLAGVIVDMVPLKLPPAVQNLLPWRWGIIAAVNLIVLFFLGLQVLLGFSLDSRYSEWVEKQVKRDAPEKPTPQQRTEMDVERGRLLSDLQHTFALRLTVFLHLLATVCAALMFWISQRGTHRPLPKLELLW